MYPYVAPHIAKIHTPTTLGIRHRAKPLVFQLRIHRPCGFDSHRPLHFRMCHRAGPRLSGEASYGSNSAAALTSFATSSVA